MNFELGNKIASKTLKAKVDAVALRMGAALLFGVLAGCLIVYFIATNEAILNLWNWLSLEIAFKVKMNLPIFKITYQDKHELAKAWSLFAAQLGFWKLVWWVAGSVSAVSFAGLLFQYLKYQKPGADSTYLRGSKLVSVNEHNSEIKKMDREDRGLVFKIGKENALIPELHQYKHFAFTGSTGGGKSTAIKELITQAIAAGHKGFVIDLGGDYYSCFGRPQDHILSLRDTRSRYWDFWQEHGARPENMAAALIEQEHSGNGFFWKSARAIFASLLRTNKSPKSLWADFQKDTRDLRDKLMKEGELSGRSLGESSGDQSDGVMGSTVLDLNFLKELNHWSEGMEPFSITNWINDPNDKSWVYVIFEDRDKEISKPLLRLWFELAVIGALNRREGDPNNIHTWLIIDELRTVGQLPSLPDLLDKGRKFKASMVAGFQAFSQVEEIYGIDKSRSIQQGLRNKFFFAMSDVNSSKIASEFLGEQEVEQIIESISLGDKNTGGKGSATKNYAMKRLVIADTIRNQPDLQCYVKLVNNHPFHLHLKKPNYQRVNVPSKSEVPVITNASLNQNDNAFAETFGALTNNEKG